eukprot:Seg5863.1 transcript_id=Seg5863.1/GoldUCD/mRNA.D3Y31 product="hypothetical protein" protein_id=Seg5863.1/GoldUCD/D3Y31
MLHSNEVKALSTEKLKSFTRLEAYQCKIPPMRRPRAVETQRYRNIVVSFETPCEHPYIPPEEVLLSWKVELQSLEKMTEGPYYVQCEFGNYSKYTIDAAIQLYRAKAIKSMVEKEIDWFVESCKTPSAVHAIPQRA